MLPRWAINELNAEMNALCRQPEHVVKRLFHFIMQAIYKYPIEITDEQLITLPEYSRPLHVGLDPQGVPCIWAKVDTITVKKMKLKVFVHGTGDPYVQGDYLGSFVQSVFVWHVFYSHYSFQA